MKGIILAGGLGSRLNPLTKITNKHLLPIYNKPMIYYPIETLVDAGIKEILHVTGGNNAGDFLRLLGNGRQFGLKKLDYTYQEGEGGIADALKLAEFFADGSRIVMRLSGTGTEGATLRVYLERYAPGPDGLDLDAQQALAPVIRAAHALADIAGYTGRTAPDVVT